MSFDYIINDYITGKPVRNVGAEASRQAVEKFLVEKKGFRFDDIRVGEGLTVQFKGEDYISSIDLIVCPDNRPLMALTCVAGSIGSYEREILSGARLVYKNQIPLAVSTDGRDAVVMDTLTAKTIGNGMDAIPDRQVGLKMLEEKEEIPLEENRKEREMIIYRSFNLEKVNI